MGAYRRLVQRLGHTRWFAAFARNIGSKLDRVMYRLTGGRLVPTGSVAPILLLTTTGRRSGRERTTPVIFVRDGAGFVVSSEDFGQSGRPAAWPLNLDAHPEARVQLGSEVMSCRARRLTDEESERFWPRLLEAWPAHATYRSRSGNRHTFLLEPHRSHPRPAA